MDCGEPEGSYPVTDRTLSSVIVWTSPQIGPGITGSEWNSILNTQRETAKTMADTLKAAHIPDPCREVSNTWETNMVGYAQPCDDAFVLMVEKTLVQCENLGGQSDREIYTLKKDGVTQGEWVRRFDEIADLNDMINPTTGEYPWGDMATQIVAAYEVTLPHTTEDNVRYHMRKTITSEISKDMLIIAYQTHQSMRFTTCDKGESRDGPFYIQVYEYDDFDPTTQSSVTPTYIGPMRGYFDISEIVVKHGSDRWEPTRILGPFDTKAQLDAAIESLENTAKGITCGDSNRKVATDGSCAGECKTGYHMSGGVCVVDSGNETDSDFPWGILTIIAGAIGLFAMA